MDGLTPQQTAQAAEQMPMWLLWVVGFAGSVTRICLLRGRGETLNMYQMAATLISGTVCAGYGANMAADWIPGVGSISLGLSAYIMGMIGMVVAEYVVTLGFPKKEPRA